MVEGQVHRYPLAWRILHWLSALIILWAMGSGFYILLAQPPEEVIHTIADFNVSITLLFVPVFIIRLVVSHVSEKPTTPQLGNRQQQLAHRVHVVMYWMVSIVLITGVLMMDRTMNVFGWFELNSVFSAGIITESFFTLHRAANILLTLLLLGHVLAVIKHQWNGVPILRKMI